MAATTSTEGLRELRAGVVAHDAQSRWRAASAAEELDGTVIDKRGRWPGGLALVPAESYVVYHNACESHNVTVELLRPFKWIPNIRVIAFWPAA